MAEPVRKDKGLRPMRVPESPTRQGPVSAKVSGEDVAGLLPAQATNKPLGEWTREALEDLRQSRAWSQKQANPFRAVREKVRPLTNFMQDRASDARHRFQVIRGRVQSGELQGRASDFADEASRHAQIARSRAEHYARNYPLQFIAAVAAAGFAIGFLLRMWRDE
jgi:ElaB/YqjD/DUF883 family membrane-anchored ribosome-binding protein